MRQQIAFIELPHVHLPHVELGIASENFIKYIKNLGFLKIGFERTQLIYQQLNVEISTTDCIYLGYPSLTHKIALISGARLIYDFVSVS